MTQTALAPQHRTAPPRTAPPLSPWTLIVHGRDPQTGHLSTWHAVPLLADDQPTGLCSLERVAGEINHPAVWMQAHKDTMVVTQDELFELLRQISTD